MTFTTVPFALLRFQYQVARFPLQLIEDRVVARMDAETPARLLYERSLGALDAAVGNILGDPELAKRGAALAERSDALRRAARLDAAASRKEEHADAELKAKREKALEDQREARANKEREVEETLRAADERKRAATETVQKRTAAAKQAVDEAAAKRQDAVETAKREEQDMIRTAEQEATERAESKLDDAEAQRSKADSRRAQADRIEELAEVGKQQPT